MNATYAPNLKKNFLGDTTVGGYYQATATAGSFQRRNIMRGYGNGTFLGRNMYIATAEYRFPLSYRYSGWGTTPFFVQRWHADIFTDAITLDGLSWDRETKRYGREQVGTFFFGSGAEVKADMTVGYHFPVTLILGLYYGHDQRLNPYGLFPFVGLGI